MSTHCLTTVVIQWECPHGLKAELYSCSTHVFLTLTASGKFLSSSIELRGFKDAASHYAGVVYACKTVTVVRLEIRRKRKPPPNTRNALKTTTPFSYFSSCDPGGTNGENDYFPRTGHCSAQCFETKGRRLLVF